MQSKQPFATEEALVDELAGLLPDLFPCVIAPVIGREIGVGFGIADLAMFDVRNESIQTRLDAGLTTPLLSSPHISVLTSVESVGQASLDDLTSTLAFSRSNLRSRLIPKLLEHGYLRRSSDGLLELVEGCRAVTSQIIAVEAKLTNWRRAIVQAVRYRWFANESYIAMPAPLAEKRQVIDQAASFGVGVIGVNAGTAEIVYRSAHAPPASPVFQRLADEKALDLYLRATA